jgi:hypothetical protein
MARRVKHATYEDVGTGNIRKNGVSAGASLGERAANERCLREYRKKHPDDGESHTGHAHTPATEPEEMDMERYCRPMPNVVIPDDYPVVMGSSPSFLKLRDSMSRACASTRCQSPRRPWCRVSGLLES